MACRPCGSVVPKIILRTLGTLIQSGVPLLEALIIARSVLGNLLYRERAAVIEESVREGKSLHKLSWLGTQSSVGLLTVNLWLYSFCLDISGL